MSVAGEIALAWLLQRSSSIAPIHSTSSLTHLEEDIVAASLSLSGADFRRFDSHEDAYG